MSVQAANPYFKKGDSIQICKEITQRIDWNSPLSSSGSLDLGSLSEADLKAGMLTVNMCMHDPGTGRYEDEDWSRRTFTFDTTRSVTEKLENNNKKVVEQSDMQPVMQRFSKEFESQISKQFKGPCERLNVAAKQVATTCQQNACKDGEVKGLLEARAAKVAKYYQSDTPFSRDLVMRIGDREVKVHGRLLGKESPGFDAWLQDQEKNTDGSVQLNDISPETLDLWIRFHHGLDIELTDNNVDALMDLANKYDIDPLKHLCQKVINKRYHERTNPHFRRAQQLFNIDNIKQLVRACGNNIEQVPVVLRERIAQMNAYLDEVRSIAGEQRAIENIDGAIVDKIETAASKEAICLAESRCETAAKTMSFSMRCMNYLRAQQSQEEATFPHADEFASEEHFPFDIRLGATKSDGEEATFGAHMGILQSVPYFQRQFDTLVGRKEEAQASQEAPGEMAIVRREPSPNELEALRSSISNFVEETALSLLAEVPVLSALIPSSPQATLEAAKEQKPLAIEDAAAQEEPEAGPQALTLDPETMSFEVLEAATRYIYTGDAGELDPKTTMELFEKANFFGLKALRFKTEPKAIKHCVEYAEQSLAAKSTGKPTIETLRGRVEELDVHHGHFKMFIPVEVGGERDVDVSSDEEIGVRRAAAT